MELRRALLLFAIVLGVAAVVAALAQPSSEQSSDQEAPPPAAAQPADRSSRPTTVRIRAGGRSDSHRLVTGRPATVRVAVDEPGLVELRELGLSEAAEPRDPAQFDLYPSRRARIGVLFTPAGGVRARSLGTLVIRPEK